MIIKLLLGGSTATFIYSIYLYSDL